jgi:hypothetical protein
MTPLCALKRAREVTDIIEVPERRAVACTLGGNIMKTLYCLTFDGQMGDIGTGKRVSRIETVSAGITGSSPKPTRHNNRRR